MDSWLQFLLESGVCLALFYAVFWVFLRNETYFGLNRLYLVSALVASLVIPLLKISSPLKVAEAVPLSIEGLAAGTESGTAVSWSVILLTVYGIGVLVLGARLVFQLMRISRAIRTCPGQNNRDCRYIFVDRDIQPFSFFRYIFLNPEILPPQNISRILAHERVHIKQYHSMDVLLMELVTILQWFNPFVWPYKKSLKETHEYMADHAVIAQGCSAAGYQLLILEQIVGGKLVELAHNFHQSQIKRRLTMMTKIKSKGTAKLKLLLVLPLAAFLVLALAEPRLVAKADSASQTQEKSEQQKKEEQIKVKKKKMEQEQKKKKIEQIKQELEINGLKIEEVKVALEKTDNPDKKKALKQTLAKLYDKEKKIQAVLNGADGDGDMGVDVTVGVEVTPEILDEKIAEIKLLYEKTDNPKKKKELEHMLQELKTKKKSLIQKSEQAAAQSTEGKKKQQKKK
jgi:hypothetical protein